MKILIASTQMPYNGGAATNAYYLIKFLRENGYKVAGLFIDSSGDPDPLKMGGVFAQKESKEIIKYLDGEPALVLAKNYVAPSFCRDLFKKAHVIYLCSGSPQMKEMAEKKISAQRFLADHKGFLFAKESDSIKKCDEILINSDLLKQIFQKNYKTDKLIAECINTSEITSNAFDLKHHSKIKKWDLCFAASDLKRVVKNFSLAKKLFEILDLNAVVVGAGAPKIKSKNILYAGKLSREQTVKIIAQSKILLNTSYFDASPSVLKEATEVGTITVLSKNCGWAEDYPAELVCNDVYNEKEWMRKIQSALSNNPANALINSNSKHKQNFLNLIESRK